MWKISILFIATLALTLTPQSLARPSYVHSSVLPAAYETYEYTPTVIGHTVHSYPTAVSHQSQTIVHEKRPYLRPIVEHRPVVKSYTPVLKSYAPITTSLDLPVSYSPLPYSGLYDHGWSPSLGTFYGGWSGAWPLK